MAAVQFTPPPSPSHSFILYPRSFPPQTLIAYPSRPFIACNSKKKETGFTDRILDYIEGGPKLRKWYGASDTLPKDGVLKNEYDESPETGEVRDAVLVTNGESEIGQMVILSLILKRARVKAIVKDKKASTDAFGAYVESLSGEVSNISFLSRALRGVRAIICPANLNLIAAISRLTVSFSTLPRYTRRMVSSAVLGKCKACSILLFYLRLQLDVYKSAGMFQALINNWLRKFAGNDEKVVIASGIPYTIVRAGLLQDTPGGRQGFCFDKGVASTGKLSKEDAARICVEALDSIPSNGLIFEVVNGDEKVEDWKQWFDAKIKNAEELR